MLTRYQQGSFLDLDVHLSRAKNLHFGYDSAALDLGVLLLLFLGVKLSFASGLKEYSCLAPEAISFTVLPDKKMSNCRTSSFV